MAAPRHNLLWVVYACWLLWLRSAECLDGSEEKGKPGEEEDQGACGCSNSRASGAEGAARKYSVEANVSQQPNNRRGDERSKNEGMKVSKRGVRLVVLMRNEGLMMGWRTAGVTALLQRV